MTKIILDLDGVLVDFVKGASRALRKPVPDVFPGYDIAAAFGMPPAQFWNSLIGSQFWKNLPWMPNRKDFENR